MLKVRFLQLIFGLKKKISLTWYIWSMVNSCSLFKQDEKSANCILFLLMPLCLVGMVILLVKAAGGYWVGFIVPVFLYLERVGNVWSLKVEITHLGVGSLTFLDFIDSLGSSWGLILPIIFSFLCFCTPSIVPTFQNWVSILFRFSFLDSYLPIKKRKNKKTPIKLITQV